MNPRGGRLKIFSWFRERLQRKYNPKKTLTVNNCPESEKDLMARWQFIRSEVKATQSTNVVHMARGNAAKFYGR